MKTPKEVASHLRLCGQMLILAGENQFKARALTNAADQVERFDKMPRWLRDIPGVGESIEEVIAQFLATGTSDKYDNLAAKVPVECLSMCAVAGIGPKKALKLHESGIHNLEALTERAFAGSLDAKLQAAVMAAVFKQEARIPLAEAEVIANRLVETLRPLVSKIEVCGSIRRRKATCKDIDIVCVAKDRAAVQAAFAALGNVLVSGDVKTSINVPNNGSTIQADLWCVEDWHWGAAVNYATGSKEHSVKLRALAKSQGMLVNEYGIFRVNRDGSQGERLGGEDEHDLYEILGVPFTPPDRREAA